MSYETLLEITKSRRSFRKFTDTPVSREDIEKIVQLGMMAPSGFNSQPWEIVVVDDKALRDSVCELLLDGIGKGKTSRGFVSAPVFLIVYGDERVRDYGPPGAKDDDSWWEFTLSTSLSCAYMSMQLAASSLGLGTMWVSAFRKPEIDEKARGLLNIPSHLRVFEMMAIGHPGMNPAKKRLRDLSDVLHYNGEGDFRSQEDIDNWF